MKQTAVEWLVEQILKEKGLVDLDIQAAKEMEKEQIENANIYGWRQALDESVYSLDTEQYYNKTFKSE